MNRNSTPVWAWAATCITFGLLIGLKILSVQCLPENPVTGLQRIQHIAEDGVSQLGTVALALIAVTGGPVMTAWVALIGLGLWFLGLVIVVVLGPGGHSAVMLMVLGSMLILMVHVMDVTHATTQRWKRLLKVNPKRKLCLILLASFGGIMILFAFKSPSMPEASTPGQSMAAVQGQSS